MLHARDSPKDAFIYRGLVGASRWKWKRRRRAFHCHTPRVTHFAFHDFRASIDVDEPRRQFDLLDEESEGV